MSLIYVLYKSYINTELIVLQYSTNPKQDTWNCCINASGDKDQAMLKFIPLLRSHMWKKEVSGFDDSHTHAYEYTKLVEIVDNVNFIWGPITEGSF